MSGVLIAACALLGAALYVTAGMAIARKRLPRIWAAARREWTFEDTIRGSVRQQVFWLAALWPVMLPVLLVTCALRDGIDRMADQGDPVHLARKVAERDRRIAQLERELGIGKAQG